MHRVIAVLEPDNVKQHTKGTIFRPMHDPIDRFLQIFEQAKKLDPRSFPDPNSMALATVRADGQPSVRIVLLKDVDSRGFTFYTNFEGRKGAELLAHPKAALCFHWPPLEVQVRVEGVVEKVTDEEADAYFATRSRGSQIGAWASLQSRPVENEGDLERRVAEYERKFDGVEIARPPFWSGFRVVPHTIEFWKNKPNRLHERHLYTKTTSGNQDGGISWKMETLYP
jgi:pyridoxamine 5'-phosphate oxidase